MTYVKPTNYQPQITALTTQLGALQVSFTASQGPDPIVAVTATTTLSRPAVRTAYKITPTANAVVTLFAANGSGLVITLDVSTLGAFTLAIALNASDAYDGGTPVASAVSALIGSGSTITLRDVALNVWHAE